MPNAKLRLIAAMSLIALWASAPGAPLYVSNKNVSTDCGIEFGGSPPPGFARELGTPPDPMPPPIAAGLAIDADRPMVRTDAGRVSPGYVLIEPMYRFTRYLVDVDKNIVATFENDYLGFTQLMADGTRLTSSALYTDTFIDGGGERGCVEEYGTDGELNWRLRLESDDYVHHHDVIKLPNGNVLALVWERISAAQAIELGRNPEFVAENGDFWFDGIIEVDPETAKIVWEWSARHHLIQDFDPSKSNYGVVADHPERLDINKFAMNDDGGVGADWTHFNGLDHNAELDQIIVSSNYLSEIYVIDHSTTPFESQRREGGRYGRGGDFLFRWGNPANYDRGSTDDRQLFNQHDVQWIRSGLPGAGNLLIFNNGNGDLRPYSTAIEIVPEMNADGSYAADGDGAYTLVDLVWEYAPSSDAQFFSFFVSGAQRLPNGNTLIAQGAGARVREVTPDGAIVWEYRYEEPDGVPHSLFRANKLPEDHPAVRALLRQNREE